MILASRRPLTPTVGPFILRSMWGYAVGDATLVGVVVVIIVIAALAYVGRALWQRRR